MSMAKMKTTTRMRSAVPMPLRTFLKWPSSFEPMTRLAVLPTNDCLADASTTPMILPRLMPHV